MRAPSLRCTSRKRTVLDSIAVYSLTGTVTRPKLIVPFQIERGIVDRGATQDPSRRTSLKNVLSSPLAFSS